jgi:3',5'-cyclic AMP phosphodiesterase CpdA
MIMRSISWLHISDIHMSARNAWSQDVVLTAMCDHIGRQRAGGTAADFILATGDLAFSGRADEYTLVAEFFDALSSASGVTKERIFCIPGNHDIDRGRQHLCFLGARASLQDQNRIDTLLTAGEDLETLLKRQENYRHFQNSYFTGQDRSRTDDGLGYLSRLTIDDVRLAIIGLDSAWLAEGGMDDHGKLLIGERQVINALKLAQECGDPPHIIVSMAHHPFHLLQEFDRRSTQERIERACHFFHCGHLHEPETHTAGCSGTGCLILAAGASFETRQSYNTYSLVTLDLLSAVRTVKTIHYNPRSGVFSATSTEQYRIELTPTNTCSVSELAQAMKTYCPALAPSAHYLSALLLDQKTEFPIPAPNGYIFGSFALLQGLPDSDLKRKATGFMTFRNALRVLYKRVALAKIFDQHGVAVREYGAALEDLCNTQSAVNTRLADYEKDAQMLAAAEPSKSFSHTAALLVELAEVQEWAHLREHAQRHLDSPDPGVASLAKRMLAFGLANSDEAADKAAAIEIYRSLVRDASDDIQDVGNLANLLMETGSIPDAKVAIIEGIRKFPVNRAGYLAEIGQKIVEATGDRGFREQMEDTIAERGKGG